MNKERYNQIIDDAYENYKTENQKLADVIGHGFHGGRLTQDEFINKCKTDSYFSETWGLKIEERELSLEERILIKNSKNIFISKGYIDDNGHLNDIGRLKLDKLISRVNK